MIICSVCDEVVESVQVHEYLTNHNRFHWRNDTALPISEVEKT